MNRQRIIKHLTSYFSPKEDITSVLLFGSAAEDALGPASDIDIAIISFKELDSRTILNMSAELQILLTRDIDLIDLNKAEGVIHYKILTKGIRIKGNSRELAEHLIKAIDFRTDFMPQLMEMQKKRIEKSLHGT